jgi:hypothetical protein
MRLLFFIIFGLLLFKTNYCQSSKIYDNGFKEYYWGISKNILTTLLPPDFKLKDKYERAISESDTLTDLSFVNNEGKDGFGRVSLEYIYNFTFFNNTLYEIELKVVSEQTENFSFVRDLRESFFTEIRSDYGKPYIDSKNDYVIKSQWKTKILNIDLVRRTEYVQGTNWIRSETLRFTLLKSDINYKVNIIKEDYSKELEKREKEKNKKKIEEFKKKL